jgi:hypothetical protein
MKKLGLYALILCSLVACSKDDDDKDNKKKDVETSNSSLEAPDSTPRTGVCGTGEPVGSSIFKSTWKVIRHSSKNVDIQEILLFEPGAVQQTVICAYKNGNDTQSVTSTARVNASITPASRRILLTSSDTQTKLLYIGAGTFDCTANLQTTSAVTYEFQGPCLNVKGLYEEDLAYIPN